MPVIQSTEIANFLWVHKQTIYDICAWKKNFHKKRYSKIIEFYELKQKEINEYLKKLKRTEK